MKCQQCGLDSPAGMRFCGHCGVRLGDPAPADPGTEPLGSAQRRHMTVMFCDIVDSTPLAESLDPEEFREVLSGYQHACARATERFNGYTARYVGDGVVVYFGYPRAHEDDAQRAVHAALGILDELAALNELLRESRRISLRVRIGLHTGTVIAGDMGGGRTQWQHEIVGEMPHIAARLEKFAQPGSVVISDVTRDFVDGYFETEPLGEHTLKGVSRPIGIHRVLRPTGVVGRLELASGRPLPPVVGRERELAGLERAWRQAARGEGGVVHVSGEAGIGKSRLVLALRERLGGDVFDQVWQCSAHHASTSLYPVIRLLERMLGLDEAAGPEQQLELLERAVRNAGLDADEAVPLLADLLLIDGGGHEARPTMAPRDARTATLRVLESLLVSDPARHPLLLVVEDLHWADPTTIELLSRIIGGVGGLPVMCVMTFRREFEPPRVARRPIAQFELGPLSAEEVRAMVTAASDTVPDASLLASVQSASDGVPLFVEEMVKMLNLADEPAAAGAGPIASSVPPTLEGLLTERLDRLPDLGDVIDVASVLGREFDCDLLEALEPMGGADLQPALALLASQGVLRAVPGAVSRFEFSHALLQEAAYERLLRRRRHAIHGRVADTITSRFTAVAEREPELIAHHWSCAAEPGKATRYWHDAGIRALERAAFQEAAEHFRRGLESLDEAGPAPGDDAERADFLTHRAASLQATHGYAAAGVDEAYALARSACERSCNDDGLVAIIRGQWMFNVLRGQYFVALDLADELLAVGERSSHPLLRPEGHLYRGLAHMYLGNFGLASRHLDEAYGSYRRPERSDQIYDAQGDTGVGALAYHALVLWNLGHAEESLARSDQSLELAAQVDGQMPRAQAWGMRAIYHLTRSEPAEFSRWVQRSLSHATEYNIGYWRTVASMFAAWLQGKAGDVEGGTRRLEEALDEYARSGCKLSVPHFYILLADLRLAAGEQQRALEELLKGEEYIATSSERFSESELHRFKGRVLMAGDSPDPAAATAAFERAIAVANEQNARMLELRACVQLASHQRKLDEPCTALDQVEALCAWFGPESEMPEVVRARALLTAEPAAG